MIDRLETARPVARLRFRRSAAFLSALALVACFHDAGRLSFAGEGGRDATVNLHAGDVRFAADVEVRSAEHTTLRYDVELLQGGQVVDRAVCEPLRLGGRKNCTYRFAERDYECSVVMACRAHVDTAGPTLVRARLVVVQKTPEFVLRRADLIVGQ